MTVLPIAVRELRVAARKRSTFWLRVVTALVACVIGSGTMIIQAGYGTATADAGKVLFEILTWMAVAAALSAGLFFTSDCLSEEKREGTLGFLFLTDLRGYDVAAGKLVATSLRCFFAFLALFPILAVTLLMGGVAGAQFWKVAIALVNALFFSLALGLLVSALGRDSQKVLSATLLLLLLLTFGGPLADAGIAKLRHRAFEPLLSLASPGYVFMQAGTWGRTPFWPGLLTTQVLAWAMFAAACAVTPRAWQEKSGQRHSTSSWVYWWKYGSAKRRLRLRRKLASRNPVLWLASRERWQSLTVWIIALFLTAVFLSFAFDLLPREAWLAWSWSFLGGLYSIVLYLAAASRSGRFFVEARQSGLTELLLSTPLNEREMVRGQWSALLRSFAPPVLLIFSIQMAAILFYDQFAGRYAGMTRGGSSQAVINAVSTVLSVLTSAANLVALAWFGMWMGATSKSTHMAALKTLLFVQLIPFLVFYFVATIGGMLIYIPQMRNMKSATASSWTTWYPLAIAGILFLLTFSKDVLFFFWSRNWLYSRFREQAARNLGQPRTVAAPGSIPPIMAATVSPGPIAQ